MSRLLPLGWAQKCNDEKVYSLKNIDWGGGLLNENSCTNQTTVAAFRNGILSVESNSSSYLQIIFPTRYAIVNSVFVS
jgi:hypothetical protein